jgi:cytochrome c-type biogenesis protein
MSSLPYPLAAFIAGLASFLSPCVLPLVPGYISTISGAGLDQIKTGERRLMKTVLLHSLLFIAGFTLVFVVLGAGATEISKLANHYRKYLTYIAGALIIVFGLHMTGILKIKALYGDKRFHSLGDGKSGWGAFLVGFAFAFGWTPCIGPFLTFVLALAGSTNQWKMGVFLLFVYSLGLAVPFLLTSLFVERFLSFSKGFKNSMRLVEVIGGSLMIVIGALILSNQFTVLSRYLSFLDKLSL